MPLKLIERNVPMLQPDKDIAINRVDSIGGAQWLQKSSAAGNTTPFQEIFNHKLQYRL